MCVCNGNNGIDNKFTAKILGSTANLKLLGMKKAFWKYLHYFDVQNMIVAFLEYIPI